MLALLMYLTLYTTNYSVQANALKLLYLGTRRQVRYPEFDPWAGPKLWKERTIPQAVF